MATTHGASSPSARLNTPETSPDTQQSETSQVVHTLAEINRNMNKMSNNRRTNIVLFNNQTLKNRGEAQTNAVDRFLLRPQPTVMTTIIKATMEGRNHIKPPKLQGVKSAMMRMTA